MKGIVVEINKKDAVILSDEGLFVKARNENYEIGQTIQIKKTRKTGAKWIAGAASMAAVMTISTAGAFAYYTPTDYVSLDVNPSIEYSVNRFDRVLDVKAMNDDGKKILSNLDLNNMDIEKAMKETLDQIITDGYLTDDPDGGVVITASNDDMDEAEQLANELEDEIQNYLDSKKDIVAEVDAEAVGLARVKEAKELGVTPGKLNLVEKLKASTTSGAITDEKLWQEEWLSKPVKEINKAIKENRKLEKENTKGNFEDRAQPQEEEIVSESGINLNNNEKPGNRHSGDQGFEKDDDSNINHNIGENQKQQDNVGSSQDDDSNSNANNPPKGENK